MSSLSRSMTVLCVLCAAGMLLFGCGGGQKAIEEYETKLKSLEANGTPDSLLSTIRVQIMQAKGGLQTHNGTLVKTSLDALKTTVAAAEKWQAEVTQGAKTHVDGLVATLTEKKKGLSGLQLKQADSLFNLADSLIKKNWYLQARRFVDELDTLMPFLIKDEAAAKKVAAKLPGTWSMTKKLTQDAANAIEKKSVTFTKEGTYKMQESMNGKTSPYLKEDWEFHTAGKYALKGDTILLSVQNEKCLRETYWNLKIKGKKQEWVKNDKKKPYDTVITDGSKDRFFTFEYLTEDFKKK
jgi:hypothetical protein